MRDREARVLGIVILVTIGGALLVGCSKDGNDGYVRPHDMAADQSIDQPDGRVHRFRDDRRPWDESFHNAENLRSHLEAGGEIAYSKLAFPAGSSPSDLQMLSIIGALDGLSFYRQEVPRSAWQRLEHLDPRILIFNECHLEEFTEMDLPEIPELQGLWIVNCNLTDAGFEDLAAAYGTQLEVLAINCGSVTDASAPVFSQFIALRELTVSGTKIGDAVISHLVQLPKLEEVEVHLHGPITVGGLEELQAAKLGLNIIRMN